MRLIKLHSAISYQLSARNHRELEEDGFTERFKFDTTPPRRAVMRSTPSLEDSEFSSSAAIVTTRIIDEEDDATSPPPASAPPSSSAPPNTSNDPAAPGNE